MIKGIEKLFECEGVIIIKGRMDFVSTLNKLFPKSNQNELVRASVFKIGRMQILYSNNLQLENQNVVRLD